jgi:hypothetical protein
MSGLDSEWRDYIRKATFKTKYNLTLRDTDIAYKTLYAAKDVPVFKWLRENPGEWTNDGDRMIAILVLNKFGIKQIQDSTTNKELAQMMMDGIGKPPASYITSCREIATDDYFQWLMKNPTKWTQGDTDTVLYNMGKNLGLGEKFNEIVAKTGVPTDKYNEILHIILQNCVCDANSGTNCGCVKGQNKYFIDKLEYDKKLLDNSIALTNDHVALNKYNSDVATWQGNRDTYKAELLNHRYTTHCGGVFAGPPPCDNGYEGDGEQVCMTVGQREQKCKYSQATIDIKMAEWDRNNKKPQPIPSTARQVDMPTSNMVCCGIDFNNINADTVDISKIRQECSLTVTENNEIVKDASGGGVGDISGNIGAELPTSQNFQDEADSEDEEDGDKTWLYILIAVIVLLVCVSSSISSSLMIGGVALTM